MPQSKDLPYKAELLPLTVALGGDLLAGCATTVRGGLTNQISRQSGR